MVDGEAARGTVLAVVEDEPDMRMLVRLTLSADPRLEVLGEASTGAEAIELARTLQPGVVILDNGLDGEMTGMQAAPLIKEAAPGSSILLFTALDLGAEVRRAPAIDAFLRKDRIGDLVQAVDALAGLAPLA